VSVKEFISIHVTFSILHAWISYFMIYNFITSVYIILKYDDNNPTNDHATFIFTKDGWGQLGMSLLLFEMVIYLTYYKDIVFGLMTLIIYTGILTNSLDPTNLYRLSNAIIVCNITLIVVSIIFIVLTILFDHEKAFYMKYRKYYDTFKKMKKKPHKAHIY
jgi:hypothetical protein